MKKAKRIFSRQGLKSLPGLLLGLYAACVIVVAQAAPTVDQVPLTVQSPVPPNIVLLLDDSGSMAWNFMPDLCSGGTANLNGISCKSSGDINAQPDNDALTNASNNGVYYNPTVTYTPPIKADGSSYANSPSLTGAYADGFTNTTNTVDITKYASTTTYNSSYYYYTGGSYDTEFNNVGYGKSNVAFSTTTSALPATCSGGTIINTGSYQSPNYKCAATLTQTPTCSTGTYTSASGTCAVTAPAPSCSSGLTLTGSGASLACTGTQTVNPNCPSGSNFDSSTGLCTRAPTSCSTTYGSGYALIDIGSSGSPNFQCEKIANPTCPSSGSFGGDIAGVCTIDPTCPNRYSLNNVGSSSSPDYECTRSGRSNSTPTCSSGSYSYNSSVGFCTYTPTNSNCPSGTSLTGSGSSLICASAAKTPACASSSYTYNAGYGASGGMCTYTPTSANCPSGYSGTGTGSSFTCSKSVTTAPTCSSGTFDQTSGTCKVTPPTPSCGSGFSLTNVGTTASPDYECQGYSTSNGSCSSGTYSTTTGQCTKSGVSTEYYFQFTTGAAAGPYTNYYVASSAQGCNNVPHSSANCVTETDTSGVAAPAGIKAGQNIANWFSYYRTRILTAKTGLTAAFDNLNPSVRLGFGSIDGNNDSALPSSTYSGSIKLATVSAFDNSCVNSATSPCAKGQSGTQRANFWKWVSGESPGNGTALRTALNTIGQYYSTNDPWQNSSSDSNRLACRQSYAIATTDGFWNDSYSGAGNQDNTKGSKITGPNGQSYLYTPVVPFSDSTSNTLADVAMKYWSTDLQTDLDNEVPTGTADPAFWQHMTTFTLGLGFTPQNITPSGTTVDQIFTWANGADSSTGTVTNAAIPSNFSWPTPSSNSINNIADLAHAAVNGHGGFYSATSPQAFSSGIADAIARVETRVGTGASLAANSTKLAVGTVTYQAYYFSGSWVGDLKAYNVSPTTGAISTTANWSASAALPAWGSRKIYTYNGSSFVQFSSASSLSTAQQNALGSTTTNQQNVINYLLGDSSNEQRKNGVYRNRTTPLGDIVNSQPVYVGAPNPNLYAGQNFTGASGYASFAAGKSSRNPVLWVAANDGIVHGIEASDGVELYGYLPGAVITNNLSNLTSPLYGTTATVPHQAFNDGQLAVADVYDSSTSKWRTILVGTTGRGNAKAVYALDVTDPAAVTPLWEKSASGSSPYSYIGQITGQPVIAQTADGTWSVLIGNGYNSSSGTAALLQFNALTGAMTVHTTNATTGNGLAAPAVWISDPSNGISTTAYAGDLNGKVWSFDLSASTGTALFTAKDSSNNVQPITDGMLAGKDPDTGNVWVFFGTGQYLTQNDLSSTATQTWYGIIVQSATSTLVSNLSNGRSALIQRSIIAESASTSTSLAGRVISPGTSGDIAGDSGWYVDLLQPPSSTAQGERMVVPNEFQGNLLIGTTLIPKSSDPCNPSGSGWVMAINPFTGTNPTAVFFDLNADGKFDTSDKIAVTGSDGKTVYYASAGVGFNAIPNSPIFVGNTMLTSFNNATTSSVGTAGTTGIVKRLSWRELVPH